MKFAIEAFCLVFLFSSDVASGFVGRHRSNNNCRSLGGSNRWQQHRLSMGSGPGAEGGGNKKSSSRIEGNQRPATAEEVSIMDEMIDKLAGAAPYELPNAVRRAFRVVSSPQFFMRIADRSDAATNEEEREKLSALATNLVTTLEVVVQTTEETLDDRALAVEKVVKAAAEPGSGEFLVPLLPERTAAMRAEVEKLEPSQLDEGFLSTVDAWMNKSHKDGMDLMVGIFQKVLQTYAGLQISRAINNDKDDDDSPSKQLLETLLRADTETWDAEILKGTKEEDGASVESLISEIQRTMENVILGLENGSMAQRVQAEYLKELVTRAEAMKEESS